MLGNDIFGENKIYATIILWYNPLANDSAITLQIKKKQVYKISNFTVIGEEKIVLPKKCPCQKVLQELDSRFLNNASQKKLRFKKMRIIRFFISSRSLCSEE